MYLYPIPPVRRHRRPQFTMIHLGQPPALRFTRIVAGGIRGTDGFGNGAYGASRTGHTHQGVDLVAAAGEAVFSPITGVVTREAQPYPTDPRYRGLVVQGNGVWTGYEVKIFYVVPAANIIGRAVTGGQQLGTAQDLNLRYPGITNHVHVELRQNGVLLDPTPFLP